MIHKIIYGDYQLCKMQEQSINDIEKYQIKIIFKI